MTMMGQPTVVGAGNDANNYLDLRKQRMNNDQGTVRIDHNFGNGDLAYFRYSAGGEYGFMPEGPARIRLLSRRSCAEWNSGVEPRVLIANGEFGFGRHLAPCDDALHRERKQETTS